MRQSIFVKSQELFQNVAELIYVVLFSRRSILAILSTLRYREEIEDIVKCCAILHNVIVEARDGDWMKGMKNVAYIEPHAEVIPIQAKVDFVYRYEAAVELKTHAPVWRTAKTMKR